MGVLAEILSSRVRAGIFRELFGVNDQELHVRELSRRVHLHEASVRQELKKLRRLDLVSERRAGNRAYFSANKAHPLFPDIHRLVLKSSGLHELLADALDDAAIELAFVFGSIARGEETAESDIDVLIIGDVGLRKLASRLRAVAEHSGREVNPHVMTRDEYRRRLRANDHFVTHVIQGPRLFVRGNDDDFAAMAG